MRVPHPRDPLLRLARVGAAALAGYHRATLEGKEHLPRGPALLVGNHGLFGLETPAFFWLLHRATGRYPIGLADRNVFARIASVLERIGGVCGSRENALSLLAEGHHVVCYPGGAREVFKERGSQYRLQWERANGFAQVAIAAGVPVVPFAGLGVDDSFVNFGRPANAGRYTPPFALGPLPVRLTFRVAPALQPPREPDEWPLFKARVQTAVERLLQPASVHGLAQAPVPALP